MISFLKLSLLLVILTFFVFLKFNKSDKTTQERVRNSLIDAITFNSGLSLFLYLFGNIFSINYLTDINEDSFLLAILIAGLFLMSTADRYYKEIRKSIKKLSKKLKGGKKW